MTYSRTERIQKKLEAVTESPEDVELVNAVAEAFGELEHDPSLLWPDRYVNAMNMSDDEVDDLTAEIDRDLGIGADVVIEVIGYIIEGRKTR